MFQISARFKSLCVAGAVALVGAAAYAPATPAPTDAAVDTLWGIQIHDPYRYLENDHDVRTVSFFASQAAAARAYLTGLDPARAILGQRIRQLDRSSVSVSGVQRVGNMYFFERQNPNDESPSLYARPVASNRQELIVNPVDPHTSGTHHSIDWFVPDLAGRYVAYGISAGGSENSTLHIYDTRAHHELPERIDRTRFGATGWLPDGKSLLYLRLPKTTAQTPITDQERFARVYLHRVSTAPETDQPVFGWHVDPQIPIAPDDISTLSVGQNSPYVLASIEHGVRNELTLYAAKAAELAAGHAKWRKIFDVDRAVTSFDVRGSMLYVLSHDRASTYKVQAISLANPTDVNDVVRPGRAVIEQIGVAKNALYVRLLDGGIGRIAKVEFNAPALRSDALPTIPLPYDGTVTGLVTDPTVAGLTFGLTGWTHSLLYYIARADDRLLDSHLKPLSPVDASPYTSREVLVPSDDGTQIPLSLIMKKDTILDGTHPTYLEGYGAYGVTLSPYFSTTRIAWLERGGVYAVAHVRGGGEFGEDWHAAAMRTHKERSIADYLACARYLIAKKYTAPAYLAGEGTSAGGIVIGGAITRAPQLFVAALDVVGVSDALRSEFSSNGPANIPEFGTVKNHDDFLTLKAVDAYQNVHDGVAYPAVMLVTGLHDPRVPSWELAKFAARLQAATSSKRPILLRIDADGGHGFLAASRTQAEGLQTDEFAFLLKQMGRL